MQHKVGTYYFYSYSWLRLIWGTHYFYSFLLLLLLLLFTNIQSYFPKTNNRNNIKKRNIENDETPMHVELYSMLPHPTGIC